MFNFLFILFVIKQLLGKVASNIDIYTAQKMTFSIKDFFSKCDQIWMPNLRDRLQISLLLLNKFNSFTTEAVIIKKPVHWICSHLLKKSLMENVIFCAVLFTQANHYPTRGSWVVVIHMETLHRHFPNSNLMTPSKKKNNILNAILATWCREWLKQLSFMEIKFFVFEIIRGFSIF